MIKEVDFIPGQKRKMPISQRDLIKGDIEEAIKNGIYLFEFEGDYNFKYLATYARDVAALVTTEALEREWVKKYRTTRYAPRGWRSDISRKVCYIMIHTAKGEDRMHVYGEIRPEYLQKEIEKQEQWLDEELLLAKDGKLQDWVKMKAEYEERRKLA